jgi:hypothetical protein
MLWNRVELCSKLWRYVSNVHIADGLMAGCRRSSGKVRRGRSHTTNIKTKAMLNKTQRREAPKCRTIKNLENWDFKEENRGHNKKVPRKNGRKRACQGVSYIKFGMWGSHRPKAGRKRKLFGLSGSSRN